MKIFWLFILLLFFHTEEVWSQDPRISLKLKNISLLQLFNTIENQTQYRFFYNNDEVDVLQNISINVSEKPVAVILQIVFKNMPLKFRELENQIILIEPDTKLNTDHQKENRINEIQNLISGTVKDISGNILPGVTIIAGGYDTGTTTKHDGSFSFKVPSDVKKLLFSYIGMRILELELDGRSYYEVTLSEATFGLDEIVVIGYGKINKADLTGSVSLVSSRELNKVPSGSFYKALQGNASGVFIHQQGTPGQEAQIRIRGIGSINQNSNPIFVIDGTITTSMIHLNPSDIESIQILKDASASAIYGADGANGVIIISTKRGAPGTPRISYSAFYSINRVPRRIEIMNAGEYSLFYNEILSSNEVTVPVAYLDHFREWYFGKGWESGSDWQKEITQSAIGYSHNIHVSGGGEKSTYSISANYFKEDGILIGTNSNRYSLRANSDFQIAKVLKLGESINISRIIKQNPSTWEGNPWHQSLIASPLMRVFNQNNKGGFEGPQIPYFYQMPDGHQEIVVNTGYNDKINPRAPLELGKFHDYQHNIMASVYLELKLSDRLTYRIMPSADAIFSRTKNWFPSFELGVRSKNQAQLTENYSEHVSLSMENQLTFTRELQNHDITLTAVHHVRKSEQNIVNGTALGFPYEQLNVISQSYENGRQVTGFNHPFAAESYLGRLIYSYRNKYLLTASLRRDGNSRFGYKNRWGTFPSISGGWRLNEDFFPENSKIPFVKLRIGWGRTGNSNIGNFQYMSRLDGFNQFSPVFGEDQRMVPALNVIENMGNPFIKWEAAEMWNYGFDLSSLNQQFHITAEYFIKNQNDLLVKKPMSAAYGRLNGPGDPWVNLGEIQNKGFELSINYMKSKGRLKYNINGNVSTIKNMVKYIPNDILTENNITSLNHSIGSFYGFIAERILTPDDFNLEGIYLHAMPATGSPSPGDLKFKDLNNDGIINVLDRTIIGKTIPDFMYSINPEITYKNFDLSFFIYGMHNFEIYNHSRAAIEGFSSQDLGHNKNRNYAQNFYRVDKPSVNYIRADINNINQNDRPSTWYLEQASFIRVKDVQLGFSFPSVFLSAFDISSARIYLSASNIFTLTRYKGRDPESSMIGDPLKPGNDNGTYPLPRSFNAGFHINF